MPQIPGIVVKTRCFVSETPTLELTTISSIRPPESLVLDEHDIGEFDFCLLPDLPPDAVASFRPFREIGHREYSDAEGHHTYRLSELMPSVVLLLADVTADQTELFCRKWSKHEMYSPFQGWEHVSPEVALQLCQEEAFQKLRSFFLRFQPLCQQAIARGKAVGFSYERHSA